MFDDRVDAGRQLAAALSDVRAARQPVVVLGIPRGGVIVAAEVAAALNAPLDVCLTHKLSAPDNPELAIGAVAEDGTTLLAEDLIGLLRIPRDYVQREIDHRLVELAHRARVYRQARAPLSLSDRIVIVVDDGVATGATLIAALQAIRAQEVRVQPAARLIAAVPIGPALIKPRLQQVADRVVMLIAPYDFWSVSSHYRHFDQVSDEAVSAALMQFGGWYLSPNPKVD
jgi:predicted phosphoribosyltransferase